MDNVARKTGEQLKESFLLLFILVSVVLVGLTWADGLSGPEEKAPSYYHRAPAPAAPTAAPTSTATATPPPQMTSTPAPAASPSAAATVDVTAEPTIDAFDVTQDQ